MSIVEYYTPYDESLGHSGDKDNWGECLNSLIFKNIIILKYPKEDASWNLTAMVQFIKTHSKAILIDLTVDSVFANLDTIKDLQIDGQVQVRKLPLYSFHPEDLMQLCKILDTRLAIKNTPKKFVILISRKFERWSIVTAGKLAGLSFKELDEQLTRQSNISRLKNTPGFRQMYSWENLTTCYRDSN